MLTQDTLKNDVVKAKKTSMRERKWPKRKETINKRKEYRYTESKRKIKATQ